MRWRKQSGRLEESLPAREQKDIIFVPCQCWSKLTKAEQLGVEIIDIEQFRSRLGL